MSNPELQDLFEPDPGAVDDMLDTVAKAYLETPQGTRTVLDLASNYLKKELVATPKPEDSNDPKGSASVCLSYRAVRRLTMILDNVISHFPQ
jgi:hypothetical protein